MRKKRRCARFFSVLLVTALVISSFQLSAFASDAAGTGASDPVAETTINQDMEENVKTSEVESVETSEVENVQNDESSPNEEHSEIENEPYSEIEEKNTEENETGIEEDVPEDKTDISNAEEQQETRTESGREETGQTEKEEKAGLSEDINKESPLNAGRTTEEKNADQTESVSDAGTAESNRFTVTIDANGGYFPYSEWDNTANNYVVGAEILVRETNVDGNIDLPTNIRNENVTLSFAGWSLSRNGGVVVDTGIDVYVPDEDCTLYAVWQESYCVTFDLNGGYCSTPVYDDALGQWVYDATEFKRIVLPGYDINVDRDYSNPEYSDPSKVFAGWSLEKNGDPIEENYYFVPEGTCTLYATWKDAFVITLDANGGYFSVYDIYGEFENTDTMIRSVAKGETLNLFPVQNDDPDYYCSGWSLERNGEIIKDINNYIPDRDMTLYAVWGNTYQVIFDANGGVFPEESYDEVNEDRTAVTMRCSPSNLNVPYYIPTYPDTGMSLSGWSTQKNGPVIITQYENGSYSTSGDVEYSDGTTFYAVWKNTVTVTLDANGGYYNTWDENSGDYIHVTSIEEKGPEGKEIYLADPNTDNENLIFAGWCNERDGEGSIFISSDADWYPLSEDCTLYAIWREPYIITFDLNGGHCTEEVYDDVLNQWVDEATEFKKLVAPGNHLANDAYNMVYNDYTKIFAGWSLEKDGVPIEEMSIYTPEGPCTLYAVWENAYCITFDLNGGYCSREVYDDALKQWVNEATEYKKIILPGYDIYVGRDRYYPVNSDPTKVIAGWSLEKNGDPIDEHYYYIPEGTCTLYAIWKDSFAITLDANGGYFQTQNEDGEWVDGADTMVRKVAEGEALRDYDVLNDDPDYYCSGWSLERNGEIIEDIYNYVPDRDMTLYAVWEKYNKIHFDANGGIFPEDCYAELNDDKTIATLRCRPDDVNIPSEIPMFPDESKWITGWSSSKNGSAIIEYSSDSSTSYPTDLDLYDGMTFYAVWNKTVTATLDANGGYFQVWDESSWENINVPDIEKKGPEGRHIKLDIPVTDNENLVFAGWCNDRDGEGTIFISPSYNYFDLLDDCTLYAVWKEPYTITFDLNGVTCSGEIYDDVLKEWVNNVTEFKKLVSPGCEIYLHDYSFVPADIDITKVFTGWSLQKNGDPIDNYSYIPEDNLTLYAIWKEPYTITFDMNGGYCLNEVYDDVLREWVNEATVVKKLIPPGHDIYIADFTPEINDPTKAFVGWSLQKNGDPIEEYYYYIPESSCTLYAIWKNTITITFDANGGYFSGEGYEGNLQYIHKIPEGSNLGILYWSIPKVKTDDEGVKHFRLWSTEKNGEPISSFWDYVPTGDCTLYAVWEEAVTITYDANGGIIQDIYTDEGAGWLEDEPVYEYTVRKNTPYYLGLSMSHPDSDKYFSGWTDGKNFYENSDVIFDQFLPQENCTLYAVWEDWAVYSLDANGGYFWDESTVREEKLERNEYGITSVPEIDNNQKIFGGWSLSKDATTPDYEDHWDSSWPTETCTLYAVWVDACIVTYDANGGEIYDGILDVYKEKYEKKVRTGEELNYSPSPYHDDNSVYFEGWSLEKDGPIIPDDIYPTGDMTLYAVWKHKNYITDIALEPSELTIEKGASEQISIDIAPEEASENKIIWFSSDNSIAIVNANGEVTGVGSGTAIITASAEDGSGITAECTVTVVEKSFSITDISAISYNKLNITWEKYEGAEGYLVYRKGNGEAYKLVKSLSGDDTTTYTNSVVSGAKYTYKISAYRMDGTKKIILYQTEEMSGTALPAAPAMQSVGMAAFNKIKVIWTKVSGCAGYVIYRSTEENGDYSVLKTVTMATATEYSNIVQDGGTYYYKIRAFVEVNGKKVYGEYSEVLSGDVIDAPPANFTLEQRTPTKIIFNWDKVEDCEGYVIYRYYSDTGKCKAIKNITSADTLTYSYKVDADAECEFTIRAFRVVNGKKVYSDYTERIHN